MVADAPAVAPGPDPARVAVILNRRARQVTDALAGRLAGVVGAENLFYTRDMVAARAAAEAVVARGYGTVACGGGDGTLVETVNAVAEAIAERYGGGAGAAGGTGTQAGAAAAAAAAMPRFAGLALGTGNALRRVVGATEPVGDLTRLCRGGPWPELSVDLIGGLSRSFTFGGMGYDADLLRDYNAQRAAARTALGRAWAEGPGGYLSAAVCRSVPRALRTALPTVEVIATSPAYYIDPRGGDVARALPAGTVLFAGPARMVALATTPYFGYGFRAFPFAMLRPGAMQVRVACLGPMATLAHLPALWRGQHRDPHRLLDFWAESVRLRCARPQPFQHSGDDAGTVVDASFRVLPRALRLVALRAGGVLDGSRGRSE